MTDLWCLKDQIKCHHCIEIVYFSGYNTRSGIRVVQDLTIHILTFVLYSLYSIVHIVWWTDSFTVEVGQMFRIQHGGFQKKYLIKNHIIIIIIIIIRTIKIWKVWWSFYRCCLFLWHTSNTNTNLQLDMYVCRIFSNDCQVITFSLMVATWTTGRFCIVMVMMMMMTFSRKIFFLTIEYELNAKILDHRQKWAKSVFYFIVRCIWYTMFTAMITFYLIVE
jgi:hypothetical protein